MNYPFEPLPNNFAIAESLNNLPEYWSLTPVSGKAPKRKEWQTEQKLDIVAIASAILEGEAKISEKTGKPYRMFASGYGLRLGDYSNGLIAIDCDGETAKPILEAIAGTSQFNTVSWTSGKPGRFQLLYKIPDNVRLQLKDFQRYTIRSWGNLDCRKNDEGKYIDGLELRYNRMQSVLPPSWHPDTGSYRWINAIADVEVAIAPQWLIDLVIKVKDEQQGDIGGNVPDWEQYKKKVSKGISHYRDLSDFLLNDVYVRLSPDQIFNWGGHNFRQFGKTLKGQPPWRSSESGVSFHVWHDGNQWAWQDKQTGEGGGAIAYRHKLQGGNGKPRGKEFIAIAKQLATEAHIDFPPYTPDQIKIAPTPKIEIDAEIAIANADILRSVLNECLEETQKEKADMVRSLTEGWGMAFKSTVWKCLDDTERLSIKVLLRSH